MDFVAEASGVIVSAAWLEINPGTDFAGLWAAQPCLHGGDGGSIRLWWPRELRWRPPVE